MNPILAIAAHTFKQGIKQRLFIVSIIIAVLIFVLNNIGVTYTNNAYQNWLNQMHFLQSGALSAMFFLGLFTGIFALCLIIYQDISSKQIFLILKYPLHWGHYLLGRYLGGLSLIFVNTLALNIITLIIFPIKIHYQLSGELAELAYQALPAIINNFEYSVLIEFAKLAMLLSVFVLFTIMTRSFINSLVLGACWLLGASFKYDLLLVAKQYYGADSFFYLAAKNSGLIFPDLAAYSLDLIHLNHESASFTLVVPLIASSIIISTCYLGLGFLSTLLNKA